MNEPQHEQLYRVRWRSRTTNATGIGEENLLKETAESIAQLQGKHQPGLIYWAEPMPAKDDSDEANH